MAGTKQGFTGQGFEAIPNIIEADGREWGCQIPIRFEFMRVEGSQEGAGTILTPHSALSTGHREAELVVVINGDPFAGQEPVFDNPEIKKLNGPTRLYAAAGVISDEIKKTFFQNSKDVRPMIKMSFKGTKTPQIISAQFIMTGVPKDHPYWHPRDLFEIVPAFNPVH